MGTTASLAMGLLEEEGDMHGARGAKRDCKTARDRETQPSVSPETLMVPRAAEN